MDDQIQNQNDAVQKIQTIRPPPFWKANPKLWFCQIESQFVNANIRSDSTKYHTVVGAIDGEILEQVSEVIINPPQENKYETLKLKIIEHFSDSEEKKFRKLVADNERGDRKPSQYLKEMRELAGRHVDDSFLKSLWLQRLPSHVQAILTVSEDNLSKLAQMADKIIEASPNTPPNDIYSASTSKFENVISKNQETEKILKLRQLVEKLNNDIKKLKFSGRGGSKSSCNQSHRINKELTKNQLVEGLI